MRTLLRLVLALGIGFGGFAAGAWARDQATQSETPTIVSGPDLGFRIDKRRGNTPVGALVVRINGQWVEVESAVGLRRLTSLR